jgi:CRP/FNR family cyclic AMP-dependent transcriptional regulator
MRNTGRTTSMNGELRLTVNKISSGGGPWPSGTLLHRLPEPIGKGLLALGVMKTHRAASVFCRQGESGNAVYLLINGLVKVTASVENGVECLLGVRLAGDMVGEMAVLSNTERSATVTTCGEVVASVIPGPSFLKFAEDHGALGLTLSQMTGDRLRWANQVRLDAAAYEVDVCLARALLALADRYGGRRGDGIDIGVPLTQAELGALVGAREVTVQRALRGLEAGGLVRRGRRRVVIVDQARLAEFAETRGTL